MSAAAEKAKVRVNSAIKAYEEEAGVQVAGCIVLEQVFHQVYLIYLTYETLGDRKFRRMFGHA